MEFPKLVVLAADHGGFPLKETIKEYLIAKGIDVMDVGTMSEESADYPAIIRKGAAAVLEEGVPGIFFCGTGIIRFEGMDNMKLMRVGCLQTL